MSREKQSRNRKEKIQRERRELLEAFMAGRKIRKEKPWLNHEGYPDPTAYLAIRNVENFIPDKVSRSCLACQMSAVRALKGRGNLPFCKEAGDCRKE